MHPLSSALNLLHVNKFVIQPRGWFAAQTNQIFHLFSVTLEGSCEGRVFDERELKFEIGDGENLGFPAGVEKAIMAMEQGEEALFIMKPKYDH